MNIYYLWHRLKVIKQYGAEEKVKYHHHNSY